MLHRAVTGLALSLLLTSCGKDGPSAPPPFLCPTSNPTLTLARLTGEIACVPGAEPGLSLTTGGASYLVVPQFATEEAEPKLSSFTFRSGSGGATASVASLSTASPSDGNVAQWQLEGRLRQRERELADEVREHARSVGGGRARLAPQSAAAAIDSVRSFKVLTSLTSLATKSVTARLRYTGSGVLIYQDEQAPSGGFTSTDFLALGDLFNNRLFQRSIDAFGAPSDIDANGRVIVLFSPAINALTPSADCRTRGYVAGYFFSNDLTNRNDSNKAEVFFSLVPDPTGTVSCAHSVSEVRQQVPVTFVHEFQHMISYNQKVIVRGTQEEVVWLNEGLSHVAEELIGKSYEPLFPDSAAMFQRGDFRNAFGYLARADSHSVTTFKDFGSLEERGGAWLFLRWLADQKGEAIFKSLVQSSQRGVRNVEANANEPFPALFGAFGVATWTDSLVGVPRDSVPVRYRFTSRNLRQIFNSLFQQGYVSRAFPIQPVALPCGSQANGAMVQGTARYYILQSTGCPRAFLRFSQSSGALFPSTLKPQAGIFRLP